MTEEQKDKIRDDAIVAWWEQWWEADYSWEGLASKQWHGWMVVEDKFHYDAYIKKFGLPLGCPNADCQVVPVSILNEIAKAIVSEDPNNSINLRHASLQDYWRDQESQLISEPNSARQWAMPFIPPRWKNGEKTWKFDLNSNQEKWNEIGKIISDRIYYGQFTHVEIGDIGHETFVGSDKRSQLRGCCILSCPRRGQRLNGLLNNEPRSNQLHLTAQQAIFLSLQDFSDVSFGSSCNFFETNFNGRNTSFMHSKFLGVAYFTLAQFNHGIVNFANANFIGGKVEFFGAKFSGSGIYFNGAKFEHGVNFTSAEFPDGVTTFHSCTFSSKIIFRDVDFKRRVSFEEVFFSENAIDSESAFRGTIFNYQVDFTKVINFPINAFDGVEFQRKIHLTDKGDEPELFELGDTIASIHRSLDENNNFESSQAKDEWLELRYGALERGSMALKQTMERDADFNRSQRYFKYELLARSKRPKTKKITKFMLGAYRFTADYGGAISRPLLWLFGTVLIIGVFYEFITFFPIGNTKVYELCSYQQNLEFSLNHTFRPFSIWTLNAGPNDIDWIESCKKGMLTDSPTRWLFIKLLATLQSFFSITMLFLFGLAVKRKFQIK